MKRLLNTILLSWLVAYMLCGCVHTQSLEEQTVAEIESVTVLASAPTPSPRPEPIPSPSLCPEPEPTITAASFPTASPLPTSPVYSIEYGEYLSATFMLPVLEDHEEYLAEDLCYYDLYRTQEETESVLSPSELSESSETAGPEHWDYKICLPQFNETLPCYSQLNSYFEELYEQFISMREDFYAEYEYELTDQWNVFEDYSYQGLTMGGHYLTVNMIKTAYYGGIRMAIIPMPVTFDLNTGKTVTLPEILNCSEEQTEELVADFVYGYFLSQGDEYYILMGRDTYLIYRPQYFYMMEQGVGVYYHQGAFDCEAAGDFLFVIPYEELKLPGMCEERENAELLRNY